MLNKTFMKSGSSLSRLKMANQQSLVSFNRSDHLRENESTNLPCKFGCGRQPEVCISGLSFHAFPRERQLMSCLWESILLAHIRTQKSICGYMHPSNACMSPLSDDDKLCGLVCQISMTKHHSTHRFIRFSRIVAHRRRRLIGGLRCKTMDSV